MWENTVWEEIQEVTDVGYEVEYVSAVAGVRGAEAEDEALEHLYYRRSMKGLAKLDIQKALGKLILRREKMSDDHKDAKKIDGYIVQLKNKLKKVEAGAQGEHKISRGYLPNLTYSNHWFNNEVLSKPIKEFLTKENKKTIEVADYLSKFSPFSENGN